MVVGQDTNGKARVGSLFVGDPLHPSYNGGATVGTASTFKIYDVKANGTLAYISEGYQGVQVIDYTNNPAVPSEVGAYTASTDARGCYLLGSVLYLSAFNHGVNIFDVDSSGGRSGKIVPRTFTGSQGGMNIPVLQLQWPTSVWVIGSYMWVADAASGLVTITTSDGFSQNFTTAGTLQVPGVPTELAVDFTNGLAYIASYDHVLQIVNIGNFSQPTLFDSYQIPAGSFATRVAISNKFAYVVDGSVEVVNPNTMIEINGHDPAYYTFGPPGGVSGSAADVKVQGTTAYVAASGGLNVYDVSSPTSPVALGSVSSNPSYGYMTVVGTKVYIASGSSGLQIYDVSTPSSPVWVGNYSLPVSESAQDVTLDGDYALIADNANGLLVVDVSAPASPVLKAQYPTPSAAYGLRLVGTTLYVFDRTDMLILDMTDPTHPLLKGEWHTFTETIRGGDVAGNFAYVAASGLVVLDVSNPLNPIEKASSYPYNQTPLRVKLVGSFAFASSGGPGSPGGLQVYDVTNPVEPVFKGFYYDPSGSADHIGLDVSGNYVFFAYDQGLKVTTPGYAAVP